MKYLRFANFCHVKFEEAAVLLENYYKCDPRESKWLLAATSTLLGRKQKAADVLTKYMKSKGYKITPWTKF